MQPGNLLRSLRVIKSKSHKRFSYSPLYYSEEKERLKEREKIIKEALEKESKLSDEQLESIRELSSMEWRRPVYRKANLMASLRFFIILMALVILFAWFFIKYGM